MPIPPFLPVPVAGETYIGREGLTRNLRERVLKGESLAVIGGPKLGKTSLVQKALNGLKDRLTIECDRGAEPSSVPPCLPGAVVILDNLDRLAPENRESLLTGFSMAGAGSIVMTGGRRLREWLGQPPQGTGLRVRLFPLSVLLDGETRMLIGQGGNVELAGWTGNHPYLTKLLLHYRDFHHDSTDDLVSASRSQWEPFVTDLADEIGDGPERQLLVYLIEQGRPVNPSQAQADTGIGNIKAVADTLAYLGAISRWIRNEAATLFAGCRLLNDYLVKGH